MKQSRLKSVISWIVQILLAVFYLLAASGKLMSRPQWIGLFRNWGFPDKFYLIVGVLEVLGAVGLLIPRLAGYAAAGLIVLMIGAAATHLINGEGLHVLRPLIFIVFLALVFYLRGPWFPTQNA
jgi:putative oxidoreductase